MDAADFAYIRNQLMRTSGIILEEGKEYLAELRLSALAKQKGLASPAALIRMLRSPDSPNGLYAEMIEAMTTNETSFFRDTYPFDILRATVIPSLIKNRAASRTLRFWCGAASSGQEPYSVLMLLREHFPELNAWRLEFLATDLSNKVLTQAREGRYGALEVQRGLPQNLLEKYFDKEGCQWRVKNGLRKDVEFRALNLIQEWPPLPPMDIVFLRNVLIYFEAPIKRTILAKIARLLQPDGYLFLGGAETTLQLCDAFERLPALLGSCYRLAGQKKDAAAQSTKGNGL